jgi:tuberous sclerosis protein 2
VCLAHQIIARWFLKSRLQWRKEYAGYIIEGIAKNIKNSDLESKHEQELRVLAHMNEDSSNRIRSSSLTEQIYKRRERDNTFLQKTKELNKQRLESKNNFNMHEFHFELIETCYDFMTRHTFSLASALPRRLPTADFLLRGGQSQSWIVENSVITITTSGCSSNPVKNGLCERCNSICKLQQSRNSLDSIRRSKDELNSEGTSIGSKPFSPFSGFSNSTSNNSMCACCCVGWAEIFIRRPTGNTSWIMKIQNSVSFGSSYSNVSLHDLTALFSQLASDDSEFDDDSKSTISSNQIPLSTPEPIKSTENITKKLAMESNCQYSTPPIDIPNQQRAKDLDSDNGGDQDDGDVSFDDDTESTSRNPVRRVNSSPDMSSNWKNNFSNKGSKHDTKDNNNQDDSTLTETIIEETQQKKKSKDTKVSCEAIPEENPIASSVEETFERPTLYTSISAVEHTNVTVVPKKQFSADDTLQLRKETSFNTEPRTVLSPFAKNMELQKVVTKPPQFPQQPLSPKTLYRGSKHISVIDSAANEDSSSRMRAKTISVIGRDNAHLDLRKNASEFQSSVFEQQQQTSISSSSGISPSFVFLQLYHSGKFGESDRPILIPDDQLSAINILDLIVPYELHRIGVLYVGKNQAKSETEILKNRFGSLRYAQFLRNLGTLVALKDAKENNLFINMDGECGKFTYVWTDEIVQVTFHVATLMPTLESDPNCNEKKKHIGNDFVLIVYNESGEEYNLNTIKGQFNYAAIIVEPLELGSNLISIQTKNDIHEYFKHLEPKIVSDNGAPLFARQIALHANMASMVSVSLKKGFADPYASNWLERLRKIKRLKKRVLNEKNQVTTGSDSGTTYTTTSTIVRDVFTKYTN